MHIDIERQGDVAILRPGGDMDATTLPAFEGRIEALLAEGVRGIVWDLVAVNLLPSTAVGFLLSAGRRLRTAGGRMVLARASRLARATLRNMGIEEVFPVFADREEALRRLAADLQGD